MKRVLIVALLCATIARAETINIAGMQYDTVTQALSNATASGNATASQGTLAASALQPNGSAASLTNFPTLNQNTTGSAARLTTPRTINGVSFDGTANITVSASVAWGQITGTLSNQSDLQNALNAKGTSNFSGAYADLTGKPTLGTAAATAITDYATAAQGILAVAALTPAGNGSLLTGLTKTQVGLANADNTSDANKPVSSATTTALNLKAPLASPTFTGTVVLPASTALVTPVLGVASGTSLAVTGALASSGTAGIGYATGAGGTVTQATSKSTGVTLNKVSGAITMHNAALAAAAEVAFTLTNSTIAANDVVVVSIQSVGTAGAYFLTVGATAAGSCSITLGNVSAGSLSQAVVLNFVVIKGVSS